MLILIIAQIHNNLFPDVFILTSFLLLGIWVSTHCVPLKTTAAQKQQEVMARYFKDILGDMLHTTQVDGVSSELPSLRWDIQCLR